MQRSGDGSGEGSKQETHGRKNGPNAAVECAVDTMLEMAAATTACPRGICVCCSEFRINCRWSLR